jgi:2-haloacid dehalogenase
MDTYLNLAPYPETGAALNAFSDYNLAILSNGDQAMLDRLVQNTGLARHFDSVLSVQDNQVNKPDPRADDLVQERLGVAPDNVLFVSSNGFDVAGAKAHGFQVAWIERVSASALHSEIAVRPVGPTTLFKALRMREEVFNLPSDHRVGALTDLVAILG